MNIPFLITLFLVPMLAFAQPTDAFGVLGLIASWVAKSIPVLIGFVVLIIFWNLGQFILHAGDEREREKYKQFIIWSVVAMFLIISFWGILNAIVSSFFGSAVNPVLWNPGYVNKNGNPI